MGNVKKQEKKRISQQEKEERDEKYIRTQKRNQRCK